MSRYVTRPVRASWVADEVWVDPMVVHPTVSDHEAMFTGLLDASGQEIWRAPNPMGFGKDDEW